MNPLIYNSLNRLEEASRTAEARGYEHKPFRNPLDGLSEAFAQGVYEAPGQLVSILDEFNPIVRLINAATRKQKIEF